MPNKPILPKRVLEQHSISRYERQQRTRKFVIYGSLAVTLLVLLLIAAAVLQFLVFEPNQAVATVNGENITRAQLQTRMKYEWQNIAYNYEQVASAVQQLQQANDESASFMIQFYQQQLQQLVSSATPEQIARMALDSLIEELLIRQEAKQRNLSVNQEELKNEIETSLGFYRATLTPFPTDTPFTPEPTLTPAPTEPVTPTAAATSAVTATGAVTATAAATTTGALTPTATQGPLPTSTPRLQPTSISDAELQQKRENAIQFYTNLGYGPEQFERVYETSLLSQKVQDAIAAEVPTKTQHYKFDYVRFNTVATATQYAQLLATSQITFQAMITQANTITQPEPLGLGANRDWTTQATVESQFGNEVLAALESAPLNQPSDVITSQLTGGYYILLPLGREVRPLEETDLSQAQRKAFDDWLAAAKADESKVQRPIDPLAVMPRDLRTTIETFQSQVGGQALPQ